MKKITLLLVFLNLAYMVIAQSTPSITPKKNSIYFEIFSNSGKTMSINYERSFKKIERKNYLGTRIGFGYINNMKKNSRYQISFPVGFNYTIQGVKHNSLEIGSSILLQLNVVPVNNFRVFSMVYISNISYKYISDVGIFLKVSFTPIFDPKRYNFDLINPWGGFSIGYSF